MMVEMSSKAIQLKPNDAEAYFGRAQANEGLGRFGETIADYSEAIRLQPDNSGSTAKGVTSKLFT